MLCVLLEVGNQSIWFNHKSCNIMCSGPYERTIVLRKGVTGDLYHNDVIQRKHFRRGIDQSRWLPLTKASDAELWCFLFLRLNKRLSKQPWGWWFETPSHSLWRHCKVIIRPNIPAGTFYSNEISKWQLLLPTERNIGFPLWKWTLALWKFLRSFLLMNQPRQLVARMQSWGDSGTVH